MKKKNLLPYEFKMNGCLHCLIFTFELWMELYSETLAISPYQYRVLTVDILMFWING